MSRSKFKKAFLPLVLIVVLFMVLKKCSFHSLPKERLHPFKVDVDERYDDNGYQLIINNTVKCPFRFLLSSGDKEVNGLLNNISPVLLDANADTAIIINGMGNLKGKINIKLKWGNPDLLVESTNLKSLPYPKGKSYKLLQGNNSYPTHNTNLSRYAFDFTMEVGDTITSTQEGFVVAVIDGYKGWGNSDKWKSYGNQVMIYDTISHLFTLYGHLKQYGSMVEVGEYVTIGQPIALSGKTGQTSEEHLHFNVMRPDNGKGGLKSYRLDSIGDYEVKKLKRYQWMEN